LAFLRFDDKILSKFRLGPFTAVFQKQTNIILAGSTTQKNAFFNITFLQGGLGVLNLVTQNKAFLQRVVNDGMKNNHFFLYEAFLNEKIYFSLIKVVGSILNLISPSFL
ncbi:hypothetical protein ACJX0J_014303, partial [Zea mays]